MKIHIYAIYFPTSKRSSPYYIGQTAFLERRMKQHLCSGSLVCNALWKFNNWQVSILHTCTSRDEANRIEIEEIRNFDCVKPNGYNLTHGGEGGDTRTGLKHTEETKRKMSVSAKGNKNCLGHKNALGHKHTKEVKEKIGKASLGNEGNKNHPGIKRSEECKEKISKNNWMRKTPREKLPWYGRKQSKKSILKMRITKLKNSITKLEEDVSN